MRAVQDGRVEGAGDVDATVGRDGFGERHALDHVGRFAARFCGSGSSMLRQAPTSAITTPSAVKAWRIARTRSPSVDRRLRTVRGGVAEAAMLVRERHRIVALEENGPPEADGCGRGAGHGGGHERRGGDGSEERAARDAGVGDRRQHRALCSCEMIRACAWLAIVVGVSAGAIARRDNPAAPGLTEVYQAGEAGYHTFRIPSVIATRNGTLLAFAEAARARPMPATSTSSSAGRDGGRTWSPVQVVGEREEHLRQPVPRRRPNHRHDLAAHHAEPRRGSRERDHRRHSWRGRTVWVLKRTDDGVTWSAPREITDDVKQPEWTWYATGPGIGIQTKGGRLVIPANHAEGGTASIDRTSSTATMAGSTGSWARAPARTRTRARSSSWTTAGCC